MNASRRMLVTGGGGFVGRHIRAATQRGEFGDVDFIAPPPGWDIRDPGSVRDIVRETSPTVVIHLAAQSFVPRSFEDPRETLDINLMGTLNLLIALQENGFQGRLLYASSGDVYGLVPDDQLPVNEDRLPEPRSPYAASKVAAEQLCLQSQRASGMDVVIARPFNHIGPGQDLQFVVPAMAQQIVRIAEGRLPPVINVGDLSSTRDFTDVRDVVAAYAAMLDLGHTGSTYVVGSGVERSISDMLAIMCSIAGVHPEIRQDPGKIRPAEQKRMVADATRLRRDTGWQPRIAIEESLSDIIKYAKESA